jgi:hypothetical protein
MSLSCCEPAETKEQQRHVWLGWHVGQHHACFACVGSGIRSSILDADANNKPQENRLDPFVRHVYMHAQDMSRVIQQQQHQ